MADLPTLLPPPASPLLRTLEQVTAPLTASRGGLPRHDARHAYDGSRRYDGVPPDLAPWRFPALWDPARCPVGLLPYLAWALSVDEWSASWAESIQREVIARSALIHARKGTAWSVRAALAAMGYGNAVVIEGDAIYYDGIHSYDGSESHGGQRRYEYSVILNASRIPSARDRREILRRIRAYAPARSHLQTLFAYSLFYDGVPRYDGSAAHDGAILETAET